MARSTQQGDRPDEQADDAVDSEDTSQCTATEETVDRASEETGRRAWIRSLASTAGHILESAHENSDIITDKVAWEMNMALSSIYARIRRECSSDIAQQE